MNHKKLTVRKNSDDNIYMKKNKKNKKEKRDKKDKNRN